MTLTPKRNKETLLREIVRSILHYILIQTEFEKAAEIWRLSETDDIPDDGDT